MSTEENKAVVGRIYDEAINQKNIDLFDELVSEDCVEHEEMPGLPTRGPAAPKAAFTMFFAAFPDLQMKVEEMIGEGDKVAMRGTMSGTHEGEFMGMPATNRSFDVQVIDIMEVGGGQVTAHWGITDQGAMMDQLGLAPES